MSVVTNPQIQELEKQLKEEKEKELQRRRAKVWSLVSHLSDDELKLLGELIHVRFHGDGVDD